MTLREEGEFDPSILMHPLRLDYNKHDVCEAKIIERPESRFLVGCRINKQEANLRLFALTDNPEVVLTKDQEINVEGFKNVLQAISV